ncbi:MAG TPA: DUF488 family protein [Ignavibacteriaceae bacterium]|nr:DUF488 family protein [Ignavibacteriaceae bacterium]
MTIVKVKRAYDKYEKADGTRILVDRLWPRGVKKEKAKIDDWEKDVAPSDALRKWFDHDPQKWIEFKKKYFKELKDKKKLLIKMVDRNKTNLTLVYAAKDNEHNNAVALKEYLEKKVLK